jgi:uncharacterized membrane protein YeaQ/YmgE (transglycosylase-associated protein family)
MGSNMSVISFVLFIMIAVVCAYVAHRLMPNIVPGGFLTFIIAGIVGAWGGGSLPNRLGPDVAGVSLIPCIIGSVVVVCIVSIGLISYRKAN